jgi:hypothetical protein
MGFCPGLNHWNLIEPYSEKGYKVFLLLKSSGQVLF